MANAVTIQPGLGREGRRYHLYGEMAFARGRRAGVMSDLIVALDVEKEPRVRIRQANLHDLARGRHRIASPLWFVFHGSHRDPPHQHDARKRTHLSASTPPMISEISFVICD